MSAISSGFQLTYSIDCQIKLTAFAVIEAKFGATVKVVCFDSMLKIAIFSFNFTVSTFIGRLSANFTL